MTLDRKLLSCLHVYGLTLIAGCLLVGLSCFLVDHVPVWAPSLLHGSSRSWCHLKLISPTQPGRFDHMSVKPKQQECTTGSAAAVPGGGSGYKPFPFHISRVHLDINIINPGVTHVTSTLLVSPTSTLNCSSSSSSSSAPAGPEAGCTPQELVLDGQGLELLDIQLAGQPLPAGAYTLNTDEDTLTLHNVPAGQFELLVKTSVHPESNTEYEGLFARHGIYATQFEPNGFSLLTFFPDRPDILPLWSVRLEADAAACPVLLSNGHLQEQAQLPGGRHAAVWQDPWPKPCYLVSAVAGQLSVVEGSHTIARTGKTIALRIYTPPAYADQLDFAMQSIKAAMSWDEAVCGREYDLDAYMMVGVEGFNGDATESKGLALFSIDLLAACPGTHTDDEADDIQCLIAHEYFHNHSGNRVTVRDWFQLTVKEGLTVFREQMFAADMDAAATAAAAGTAGPPAATTTAGSSSSSSSRPNTTAAATTSLGATSVTSTRTALSTDDGALPALLQQVSSLSLASPPPSSGAQPTAAATAAASSWRRALEAKALRCDQFSEDDGPLMHAIRPSSELGSMANLYTDTVYHKGAEVVRLFHTLLGPEGFMRGLTAFFDTHDGQACTCEDFCQAMFAASPAITHLSPTRMMRWYDTPGTPLLTVKASYSPSRQTLTLTVQQELPDSDDCGGGQEPLPIPLKVGLLGPDGQDLPLHLKPTPTTSKKSSSSSKRGSSKGASSSSSSSTAFTPSMISSPGLSGSVSHSMVLLVDSWTHTFTFSRLPDKPALSLLRDFSAPVRLEVEGETDKQLGFLATHDSNPFARWDALQRLMTRLLLRLYEAAEDAAVAAPEGQEEVAVERALAAAGGPPPALLAALKAALASRNLDGQYKALLLDLPGVMELVPLLDEPDPLLLWEVRVHVGQQLASQLQPQLQELIERCDGQLNHMHTEGQAGAAAAGFVPAAIKVRAARNAALGQLSYLEGEQLQQQLLDRYYHATCMTDRLAALECLNDDPSPARDAALSHFYDTYAQQPLVLLKWLWLQAASDMEGNVQRVRALLQHPAFDITSPAACEALLWGFASSVVNFHAEDGSGYRLLADAILQVDKHNPVVAANAARVLTDWACLDPDWQKLMLGELQRLAQQPLSEDVMEIVHMGLEE